MLARGDAADNTIPESEVEPMGFRVGGTIVSLSIEGASIMVSDVHEDTVDDVVPFAARRAVSCLVEYDKDLSFGDILLSRNANVRTSLFVSFTTTHTQWIEFNLAVPNKDGAFFRMAPRGLDAFQESGKAARLVPTLHAIGTEQLAKIDPLGSHGYEILDWNRRL